MKNVFIVSGASGSGQDTLIELLAKELPLERVITTTTRPMRPNESDGHPYHFIDKNQFVKLKDEGVFLEYAQTYNGEWYGVTRTDFDHAVATKKTVIWKVDFKGVANIKKLFPSIKSLFIDVPEDVLKQRLIRRDNPTPEYLASRMNYIHEWSNSKNTYDYIIKNEEGHLEEAVQTIKAIILRESATRRSSSSL